MLRREIISQLLILICRQDYGKAIKARLMNMHEIGSSKLKARTYSNSGRDYAEMMRQTKEETKEQRIHEDTGVTRVEGLKGHSTEMARKNRHSLTAQVIVLFSDATQLRI
jgi:hypothetical protein